MRVEASAEFDDSVGSVGLRRLTPWGKPNGLARRVGSSIRMVLLYGYFTVASLLQELLYVLYECQNFNTSHQAYASAVPVVFVAFRVLCSSTAVQQEC